MLAVLLARFSSELCSELVDNKPCIRVPRKVCLLVAPVGRRGKARLWARRALSGRIHEPFSRRIDHCTLTADCTGNCSGSFVDSSYLTFPPPTTQRDRTRSSSERGEGGERARCLLVVYTCSNRLTGWLAGWLLLQSTVRRSSIMSRSVFELLVLVGACSLFAGKRVTCG